MFLLQILLLCPAAGAREMQRLWGRRRRGLLLLRGMPGGGPVGRASGPARAAPRGRHTRANPHELAINEECTRTCSCGACWNGTGTARDPASWNGSGRNMQKMCKEYAVICKKYAQHM